MKKHLSNILFGIALIVLLNFIASLAYFRMDLTSEKRHTLSNETKSILTNLEDNIYIKVYLKGDFPSGFKRLQKETNELLAGFESIANGKLVFEFINPSESADSKEREAIYKQLYEQGLQPTDLQVKNNNGISSSMIFPGAIIYYKDRFLPVHLLKQEIGIHPEEALNNSIESLEYEFASTISKLTKERKERIAFLQGNKELGERELADISYSVLSDHYSLSEYYDIQHFDIKEFELDSIKQEANIAKQLEKLNTFRTIIIANPKMAFNNLDKFLIDQYIMQGGRVLWVLDGALANMDSLQQRNGFFMAEKNPLNLDDMLFKYGIRINADLIQDQRSAQIPIITGYSGNMPQQSFFSWPYYPLLFAENEHIISHKLDAIKCEFVSSLDTIKNHIKKSVLLHSSEQSAKVLCPHQVSLGILQNPPKPEYYSSKHIPIAVLLEGNFTSIFKNRLTPKDIRTKILEEGKPSRQIVIADGDIIANNFSEKSGNVYPLGYDKYGKFIYSGNKTFIINAVHYLCDNNQDLMLSTLKTKELRLRLLNREKIQQYKLPIQIVNLMLPIVIILLFWIIYSQIRKKKYA